MRRTLLVLLAWLAAFAGPCTAAAQTGANASVPSWQLSRSQVRALQHARPSTESCDKLTAYFRGREEAYRNQAEQMNLILMQRQITAATAGGRYAQSIDSGERLRKFYLEMAREMGNRAAFWARKRQQLQ